MTLGSPKGSAPVVTYPKTITSIAASVGGLALFLVFASYILISGPIGSTVHGYFYGVDRSVVTGTPSSFLNETVAGLNESVTIDTEVSNSPLLDGKGSPVERASEVKVDENQTFEPQDMTKPSSNSPSETETREEVHQPVQAKDDVLQSVTTDGSSNDSKENSSSLISNPAQDMEQPITEELGSEAASGKTSQAGCNLYDGKWVYDQAGPLYTHESCPVLTESQNCQKNGRPDKEYEHWRWKPTQCDLPRFDGKRFLNLMRGKTLAYIGDSVARNQMESMLCMLWQVEVPKNRGNRRMQRYYFRSTSTMIVRIWSSWLIHRTTEQFDFAPEGVDKLFLDAPDETFMDLVPTFDVLVLSSGHWFAKQSVYILNNEIVGGQLWWPDKNRQKKIDNIEAFGISVETILTSLITHPNYTGLTVVRSYSPDHYEGGAWNTGGSCTGKVHPASDGELVENGFTNIMHEKQVNGFNRAIEKQTNRSKLRLMDITKPFSYRHDGHPGPYRSSDPNKITTRGPDGRPPPQDCLHWCMPGAIDTWNELLLETIRREFDDSQ